MPDHLRKVPHIGTYRRDLPVSLDRLYENAIDWEHLPYLHNSSFSKIDCIDAGESGFRVRVWPQPFDEARSFIIELRLDRDLRRWITTTIDGPGSGTEIWTHASVLGERMTLVVVDFFVPGAPAARIPELAEFYSRLYKRLYDEDVLMMTERQRQLDHVKSQALERGPIDLGILQELRRKLPLIVESGCNRFRIVESAGELIAHAAICPHRLGPLTNSEAGDGTVQCQWHGYRFDLRTRECVSGARLRLPPAPRIHIARFSNRVTLRWD